MIKYLVSALVFIMAIQGMELTKVKKSESEVPLPLSPVKHYVVPAIELSKNKFLLNIDPIEPSVFLDYQWNGKSIAQCVSTGQKFSLKSNNPECYSFLINNHIKTGDFSIDLNGKLTLKKTFNVNGAAYIACKSLKNKNDFRANKFYFTGKSLINTGVMELGECAIEKCDIINKNKWIVKEDCHLKEIEKFISSTNSSWLVIGSWVGTFKEFYLDGNSSAEAAALFSVEKNAWFNGQFKSPILHIESSKTLETTASSIFFTNYHLSMKAKDALSFKGSIRDMASSDLFFSDKDSEILKKQLKKGVFLQSETNKLFKYGNIDVLDKPVVLIAKKQLIHDQITQSLKSEHGVIVLDAEDIVLEKGSELKGYAGQINAQESIICNGKIKVKSCAQIHGKSENATDSAGVLALSAKNIFTEQTSQIDAKKIYLLAQENIKHHGAINAQESLVQNASTIETGSRSSVRTADALVNGTEKISQNGKFIARNNLLMRSKYLYNSGNIQIRNSRFKADRWWINCGIINCQDVAQIDALFAMNIFPGQLNARVLKRNSLGDLNLGFYRAQNADINSILSFNAGDYLFPMRFSDVNLTEDNLKACIEQTFLLMSCPAVQTYYRLGKFILNLGCTGDSISKLYNEWAELPKKYQGASDLMPLLAGSVNFALDIFQQVKSTKNAFEKIQEASQKVDKDDSVNTDQTVPNSEKNPGKENSKNELNTLDAVKILQSIIVPFLPHQNYKALVNINSGTIAGINGQFKNVFDFNLGKFFFAHSYKLDTWRGANKGLIGASNIVIQGIDSYTATKDCLLGSLETQIEAPEIYLQNNFESIVQVILRAEKKVSIEGAISANRAISVIAPEVTLDRNARLASSKGVVSLVAENIETSSTVGAQSVQIKAKTVSLEDGSNISAKEQEHNAAIIIHSEDIKAEKGSKFIVPEGVNHDQITQSSQKNKKVNILLCAQKTMELKKESYFDSGDGQTAIVGGNAVIGATMRGGLQTDLKNLIFASEHDINLRDAHAIAEEKIVQKGKMNADNLYMRAKFVENSGKLTMKKGLLKADRWYWNTGSAKSETSLDIDALLSVNWRSYTQAKYLTTNSLVDINLLSSDLTQELHHNSLLSLDLSSHLPLLSREMIASEKSLQKVGERLFIMALPPHLKGCYRLIKMFSGIKGLIGEYPQLYNEISNLYYDPNAGASDWVPVINKTVGILLATKQMAQSAHDLCVEGAERKQERDESDAAAHGQSSKQQDVTLKEFIAGGVSLAGLLIDQSSTRQGLIDLKGGLEFGFNGSSMNLVDVGAGRTFVNYQIDTGYGRNLGLLAASNLSVNAKNYANGVSLDVGGVAIETPACIAGQTVAIKADSFTGSDNSKIASTDGASLEVNAIDKKGSVEGSFRLKFTGAPEQLKNIGKVDAQGGSFSYEGPIADQDNSSLPSADELAKGESVGKWGSIKNASAISVNAGKQDINLREQHDLAHSIYAKTKGSINVNKKMTSEDSIRLHAGKNLSHKSLKASTHIERIAQQGTISAISGVERVEGDASYEDRVDRVIIEAGKSNTTYAGVDILQKAVEVTSGKEGTVLVAKRNIVDEAIECQKYTECQTPTEHTKDTQISSEVAKYNSQGGLTILAGGKYIADAPQFNVKSQKNPIQGLSGTEIRDVKLIHNHESDKRYSGWWSTETTKEKTVSYQSVGPRFEGKGSTYVIGSPGQKTILVNPQSDENIILHGDSAEIILGQNKTVSLTEKEYGNRIWETKKSQPTEMSTYAPIKLNGIENHTKSLFIQLIKNKTCTFLDKINNVNEARVTVEYLDEYRRADISTSRRLTNGGRVVLGLAIGLATQGVGTTIAAGLTSAGIQSGISTVLSHMSTGTINSLLNKAANTLIETGGDIHESARRMATCQTLKETALVACSAGVISAADHVFQTVGLPCVQDGSNLPERLAYAVPKELMHAGIKTGFAVLAGQSTTDLLPDHTRNFVATTLHTALVSQIADLYASGAVNSVTHKFLHGAAGATYGGIINGERGALAGGLGAFTAEIAAELLAPSKQLMDTIAWFEGQQGHTLNQQEFMVFYAGAMQEYLSKTFSARQIAQFTAAITALAAGQDVEIGHDAAVTALENNFLVLAMYGITAASTAYSGYRIYKSYEEDGAVGALKQLGIEVAYNAAGQAVGRIGGMMYPSVKAAVIATLDEVPALKLVLGNLTDKLIVAAEKINQTAIGQAVNKVEAVLLEKEAKLLGRFGLNGATAVENELAREQEHAVEEMVLAGTDIRIKVDKSVQSEIATLRQTSKTGHGKQPATQIIKGTREIPIQPSREKILPKMKTYEEARNKALEMIKDVDGQNGYPHIGNLGTCENKLAGRSWERRKVTMRLDYDPEKGPHINFTDCRLGKGTKEVSICIPFEGNEETVETLLKHLNTISSFEHAKSIFTQTKDEANLFKLFEGRKK